MNLPRIGISLGDPGGIGPEVILKALKNKAALPLASYVLFGSLWLVQEWNQRLGIKFSFTKEESDTQPNIASVSLHEVEFPLFTLKPGIPDRNNGKASFLYFKKALEQAQKGNLQAVVTAPVAKRSWSLADVKWAGHTDYLSQLYPHAIMFFWSKSLKVALFSHHVSLQQALKKITRKNLLDFIQNLHASLKKAGKKNFHFFVAGLNPHGGEEGLLGKEESETILPAIQMAKKTGIPVSGPHVPDVIFRTALNQEDKIVIALYHDQGLIPFKLAAFENGVNVTLGLPFIRTSPDHGTAFDIAGQGTASQESMVEALKLAWDFISSSKKEG
ncbi:MAG: 4-hydroxythreonine-4-phosphate dehydrogenase PdxA [Acidobacteriota bacterium]